MGKTEYTSDMIAEAKKPKKRRYMKITPSDNGNGYKASIGKTGKKYGVEASIEHTEGPRRETKAGIKITGRF